MLAGTQTYPRSALNLSDAFEPSCASPQGESTLDDSGAHCRFHRYPAMKITDHQWKTLGDVSRDRFEQRLQLDLTSRFPLLQEREPAQVRRFVHERVGEALRLGIRLDQDICRYLEILLDHGPGVTRTDRARAVLDSPSLSGEQKVLQLDRLALFFRPHAP